MSMHTNTAADEVYAREVELLSDDQKLRLVELIVHELASRNGGRPKSEQPDAAQRQAARERLRRHAGAVSLGRATGADNDSIDADLAREYGSRLEPR